MQIFSSNSWFCAIAILCAFGSMTTGADQLSETIGSTEGTGATTEPNETVASTEGTVTTTEPDETVASTQGTVTTTEPDETVASTEGTVATTQPNESVASTQGTVATTERDKTVASTKGTFATTEPNETVASTEGTVTTTEPNETVASTEGTVATTEPNETVASTQGTVATTEPNETVASTEGTVAITEPNETVASTQGTVATTEPSETVASTEGTVVTTEPIETVPSTEGTVASTQQYNTVTSSERTNEGRSTYSSSSSPVDLTDWTTPDLGTFRTSETNKPSTKTKEKTSAPTTSPKSTITNLPYPEPTLANFHGTAANKTVRIQVKVNEESSNGCDLDDKSTCEQFKSVFISELEPYYKGISGFADIIIENLSKGSIIVEHTVVYTYSEMSDEDRTLTADDVYAKTVGPGIVEGSLGDLRVTQCDDCKRPRDTTDLCNVISSAECVDTTMEKVCSDEDSYVYCVSPCARKENPLCSSTGQCIHIAESEAFCKCSDDDSGFYFGDSCSNYFNTKATIIGISVGGGFVLGIVATCLVIRCRGRRRRLGGYRQYYTDDMGEEGYLWNESYAVDDGENQDLDEMANEPKLEFTFDAKNSYDY